MATQPADKRGSSTWQRTAALPYKREGGMRGLGTLFRHQRLNRWRAMAISLVKLKTLHRVVRETPAEINAELNLIGP